MPMYESESAVHTWVFAMDSDMRPAGDPPDVGHGNKERIQYKRNDQTAKPLDQIGRDTCRGGRRSVQGDLTEEVSSGNDGHISDSAKDDSRIPAPGGLAHVLIDKSGDARNDSFDGKCNRYVDKISAQQVCHGRADSCG